jgi:fatty-acyl-CoA synthase
MAGARLVLPGPRLDGASLYDLMESERVTISAGVPTVWQNLIGHVEQHGLRFTTLRRMVTGGSAMPASLIAKCVDEYQIEVRHGWGMTETTAVATMSSLESRHDNWPAQRRHALIARQGKTLFGVEMKVADERGATLPRDGESQGELLVRGQWIIDRYFKGADSPLRDGWFATGDIAAIDPDGVLHIRDRTKDVIKSGGEWISSIDLECAAVAHPAVAMAAVIGIPDPKWLERPLLFIVLKAGHAVDKEQLLEHLGCRVAKWWLPDDIVFLQSLPVGGTGKVQKEQLRRQYRAGAHAGPHPQ